MIILKTNNKEIKIIPRTRKVVELTDSFKTKNLNELIFNGLYDGNVKVLAELIKAFGELEDKKPAFNSIKEVYDFIDDWKEENDKDYKDLYKEVIEVVNEMGFFKEKMNEKDLKDKMDTTGINLDMNSLIKNSAQKVMDGMMGTVAQAKMEEEDFKGYKA